jgi:hypothetical protein
MAKILYVTLMLLVLGWVMVSTVVISALIASDEKLCPCAAPVLR